MPALVFCDLGEEFRVRHGGVEGAAQRGQPVGRHARRREERGADLGRIHDRAQHGPLLVVAGELDGGRNVGQLGVPLERELHQRSRRSCRAIQSGWATFSAVQEVEWPSTSPRSTASMASFEPR